jgi:hypothetical protein
MNADLENGFDFLSLKVNYFYPLLGQLGTGFGFLAAMPKVNMLTKDIIAVKLICIRLFQVPSMFAHGTHHHTILVGGKPPPQRVKYKISCRPPNARNTMAPNRARESLRSRIVLFEASQ